MNNFTFQNPVKLIFGKGSIAKLAKEIPADKKIMVTFGGGSVKKNGVYDQVVAALKGRDFVEFWGIEPNPKIETLRKAIAQGKAEKVDFLLSVGGGSVLDGTKLIAAGIPYDGDAWELVLDEDKIGEVVPFGDVMTLPATGSEMNAGAVISNLATQEKFAFHHSFPQFSILDPEATFSLPPFQVACGIADTFVHVMEQYLTVTGVSPLMDRWAEGILQTLIEIAPKNPSESARLRPDGQLHALRDDGTERLHRHGRAAGLGDPHDRTRTDGPARRYARTDPRGRTPGPDERNARTEEGKNPAIRRAGVRYP